MMKRRFFKQTGFFFLCFLCLGSVALADSYTVRKGDNLFDIARQFGIGISDIQKANNLTSNRLMPGQVLQIPQSSFASNKSADTSNPPPVTGQYYTIQKGDTLASISRKTGVSVRDIAELNSVTPRKLRVGRRLILSAPNAPEASDAEDNLVEEEEESPEPAGTAANDIADTESSDDFLGMWQGPEERKLLIKVATGFLGAPYRLGGASVRGMDCSAFVQKMYEFFDIKLPRTAREQSAVGVRIDRHSLTEGDLVFFRTRKPIGHVGIYIGGNKFVHASYKSKAVRIDDLDQPYFSKRFLHAVRVKGLNENDDT